MTDDRIPQRFRYKRNNIVQWGVASPLPGSVDWIVRRLSEKGWSDQCGEKRINVLLESIGCIEIKWLDHDYDWSGKPTDPEPPVKLYSVAVTYERVLMIAAVSEQDALECTEKWYESAITKYAVRSDTVTGAEPMPPGPFDSHADDCTGKAAHYFKDGVYSPQGATNG